MKKRILAVVLAAAMLALLVTGCSANGTADNSKDGAVALGGLARFTALQPITAFRWRLMR